MLSSPSSAKRRQRRARKRRTCRGGHGPTVLEALDVFRLPTRRKTCPCGFPFRMSTDSTTAASWPGASRPARCGWATSCCSAPRNKTSTVKTIERWNAPPRQRRRRRVDRHHADRADFRRARRRRRPRNRPAVSNCRASRRGCSGWARSRFRKGKTYKLKLATQEVECRD